jgi:hypothetical protein
MQGHRPQVLLAGETASDATALAEHLQRWGCEMYVATTFEDACELLADRSCDLVLSDIRLADGSAYPLVTMLVGSGTTLYFFQPVREGCWWLPAVRRGEYCWGAPALRPAEFARALEQILTELTQVRFSAAAATVGVPRPAAPASVLAPTAPRGFAGAAKPSRAPQPAARATKGKSV